MVFIMIFILTMGQFLVDLLKIEEEMRKIVAADYPREARCVGRRGHYKWKSVI